MLENTVVVSRVIKIFRHFEDFSGARGYAELTALTAFGFYDYSLGILHARLLNK